jgi:hypothetical protein
MPRAKPSDWRGADIDLFSTGDLISDDELDALIARHFGAGHSNARLDHIRKSLRSIMGSLRLGLHYRERPSSGERGAAMDRLARTLAAAVAAIDGLDPYTRRSIEDEAKPAPPEYYVNGEPVVVSSLDLRWKADELRAITDLIALARRKLQPDPAINFPLDEERAAVQNLSELWSSVRGGAPTIGPFTAFVTGAIGPVLRDANVEKSLAGLIGEVLYR